MHLPESPITPSTRHGLVDVRFAAVLEEHFGIPTAFVLRAPRGEPHQPAVALCRLATRYKERNETRLILPRGFGRGQARRRRIPCPPPRGHGQTSPWPYVDRSGPGRASTPMLPEDSLRGVVCDPDAPDPMAERVAV